MTVLLILIVTILVFGFVVFFGAPYLPTTRKQINSALDLLDLKPGQVMLELGSGDGRVLNAAASRGWQVVGYELNPILVLVSRLNTWRYRKQIKIVWGDFWRSAWPKHDGVFVFLLDRYMKKLDKKIIQESIGHPRKVVSFAFKIPGKKPAKAKHGVYLYTYK